MRAIQPSLFEISQAQLLDNLLPRFAETDPSAIATIKVLRTDIRNARWKADTDAITSHYAPTLRNVFKATLTGFNSIAQGMVDMLKTGAEPEEIEDKLREQERDTAAIDVANSTNDLRQAIGIYMQTNPDHGVKLSSDELDALKIVHVPNVAMRLRPL